MIRHFFYIFLFVVAIGVKAHAAQLVQLETMSDDDACGLDSNGQTSCYSGKTALDTVDFLALAFNNDNVGCGYERGTGAAKCWSLKDSDAVLDGKRQDLAFRDFFSIVKPNSIRTSASNICGLRRDNGDLTCLLPSWFFRSPNVLHVASLEPVTDLAVSDDRVCWAEGKNANFYCVNSQLQQNTIGLSLIDADEVAIVGGYLCARSKTDARCQDISSSDRYSNITLPPEAIEARSWHADDSALCVVTKDPRIVCIDASQGTVVSATFGRAVPAPFDTPNPGIESFWSSNGSGCVRHDGGKVDCWDWWNSSATPWKFSRPVLALFGSSYGVCARLDDGQIECRANDILQARSLPPGDRVRMNLGSYNQCSWNSHGLNCTGFSDLISYRSVTDVSISGDLLCVVGVPADAAVNYDSVRCFTYQDELRIPPIDFRSPTAVIAGSRQACAISDEGLTCWGQAFTGIPIPQTPTPPKKVVLSEEHGCLIDDFGLACWGDLASSGLEIPPGLEQAGRVKDVAVAERRTCAILDDGTATCWGSGPRWSSPRNPPAMIEASSILGGRSSQFCATDKKGLHCWGGNIQTR